MVDLVNTCNNCISFFGSPVLLRKNLYRYVEGALQCAELPDQVCLLIDLINSSLSVAGAKKKAACPGLGLFYTILSAFLFSVASLLLKKIEDVHSVEVSAFRCVFQMAFVLPGLIYYK